MMPGISHASFQQRNYRMVYDILHAWYMRVAPVYR
jgi:non-heme chloroperoxidase